MPITLLDIIVLAVMLLSGLLAMIRGFMREVLSIAGWVAAAITAYLLTPKFVPSVKDYLHSDSIALVAVAAAVFLLTLLVATIVTARISDLVLDSRIGALDRTLGFFFGLARGLLIVVVAFAFFDWLVPDKQQPDWVRSAKSLAVLQASRDWMQGVLPEGLMDTISKKLNKSRQDDQTDAAPEIRNSNTASAGNADGGYGRSERDGLRRLIEGKAISAR